MLRRSLPILPLAFCTLFFSTTASTHSVRRRAGQLITTTQLGGVSPAITTGPQSQRIASGATATLSVTASGTGPLTYQWYAGVTGNTANPIAGATGSTYTTPALTNT